ncbi:lateral flagellar hook-length control protein LafE [Aeromonas hydrophila]|uniref:lateral flagellar hook-length control protein LafE n=1 Tax=Aeromonas hydrophila TaxID=644 RepID=UPI0022AF2CD8|nr:lateral flagellar hook-length control protein LafE [Aeromonas hydrophila]ELB2790728.1 lateral flagellar hook-length control protein LafE [Aeromonas hydrophila]MCZ4334430.1 lateral flagellar hook-length control protein LafE [Aeromonas hydrophila]
MGMIQFPGLDGLAALDSAGFSRLSRQPDGQGDTYQPLDLPFMEELVALPLPAETIDEKEPDVTDEQRDDATEQLDSFSNLPPVFLLTDDAARLSMLRQAQPVAATTGEGVEAARPEGSSAVSAVLRSLSAYGRSDYNKVAGETAGPQSENRVFVSSTDASNRMGTQPAGQTMDPVLRDKVIASVQPLLASEGAGERESTFADVKGVISNLAPVTAPKSAEYQWAPVKLADNPAQWGQQLIDVLKDKVELQVNQQIKQAHIRLDPPELGRLELTVRLEGDRLNVQLNVTNPAVREALIQSMERLRMSLAPHHAGGVEVNVGQGGEQERQGKWQQQQIMAGRRQWQEEFEPGDGSGRDWLNTLV